MADVLTKAGVLLAIIVLAYALKRIGVFQTADYQILSKLVFRLSLPCAVITAFSEGFQRSGEMYLLALFGLGANVLLWGCCYLACRKRGESSCAFYTQSVAGYNIGAFTLPFIQSFLGSSGVVIACMFDMGNSVMCTGGNYALTSALMGKTEGNRVKSFLKRFFSSVPIDTYLLLVLLNLCGLSLPLPVLALTLWLSPTFRFRWLVLREMETAPSSTVIWMDALWLPIRAVTVAVPPSSRTS